jgi:hypothetical protein
MRFNAKISIVALAISAAAGSLLLSSAQPASARIADQNVASQVSAQRDVLLIKERRLNQDLDDLQHKINDLQKDSADPRLIDDLCRQSDIKFQDLKVVRYNIRQLEVLMM